MSSSLSPSSSLSSPSLLSAPFSVLPPELTQLIIEHAVPHSFHSKTYKSRQSTLCSLCLVSKSFHHFARPLLLTTLWIEDSSNYKGWKGIHVRGNDKRLCREFILDDPREKLLVDVDLAGYAGLRTLVIAGSNMTNTLDLSILGQLSHLTVLRLTSMAVSASTPFSLLNPTELSLCEPVSIDDQARILNPSTLPSLRLFAYHTAYVPLPGIVQALNLLTPQLLALSLDYNTIKLSSPDLLSKLNPITLFDAEIEDLAQVIPVSYLSFDFPFGDSEDNPDLADRLSQAQVALPLTIVLPLSASPAYADYYDDEGERLHLLEVCAERGLKIVYEDIRTLWHLDSGFSEHFLEKMKEERRKEEGKIRK